MKFVKTVYASMRLYNYVPYKLKHSYLHSACFNTSVQLLVTSSFSFCSDKPISSGVLLPADDFIS